MCVKACGVTTNLGVIRSNLFAREGEGRHGSRRRGSSARGTPLTPSSPPPASRKHSHPSGRSQGTQEAGDSYVARDGEGERGGKGKVCRGGGGGRGCGGQVRAKGSHGSVINTGGSEVLVLCLTRPVPPHRQDLAHRREALSMTSPLLIPSPPRPVPPWM